VDESQGPASWNLGQVVSFFFFGAFYLLPSLAYCPCNSLLLVSSGDAVWVKRGVFFSFFTNNNILQARYRPPALQIDVIMSLHEIVEKDEAGNVTATYVGVDKGSRVDVVVCVIFSPPFVGSSVRSSTTITLDQRLCSTPCMLSIIWIWLWLLSVLYC